MKIPFVLLVCGIAFEFYVLASVAGGISALNAQNWAGGVLNVLQENFGQLIVATMFVPIMLHNPK